MTSRRHLVDVSVPMFRLQCSFAHRMTSTRSHVPILSVIKAAGVEMSVGDGEQTARDKSLASWVAMKRRSRREAELWEVLSCIDGDEEEDEGDREKTSRRDKSLASWIEMKKKSKREEELWEALNLPSPESVNEPEYEDYGVTTRTPIDNPQTGEVVGRLDNESWNWL